MEKKPDIVNRRVVYDGFFSVREDEIVHGANRAIYTVLSTKVKAVVILAEDREGRFLLSHEYRHGVEDFVIGCPGGRVEPQEDLLSAAKREFLEETGYRANSIHFMGNSYPIPSICDQELSYFFSNDISFSGPPNLEPLEIVETKFYSGEEIRDLIKKGKGIDSMLITALFYRNLYRY